MERITKEFYLLIQKLKEAELADLEIITFIYNNIEFLKENQDLILNNISFIYNNKELYCILIIIGENYAWSTKEINGFQSLKWKKDLENNISNEDIVVDNIMLLAKKEKIKKAIPEMPTLPLEKQIALLKTMGLNSQGYNLK